MKQKSSATSEGVPAGRGDNCKKVGIYTRVSTEEQATSGISLEAQKEKLRQYCNFNGWILANEYTDAGLSGGTLNRPGLQQLLGDAKKGLINVVLVYKLDRLSRSLRDIILTMDDFRQYNIDFISLNEKIDTTSSVGKLMFHIIGAFAEFERDIIRERVIFGMDKKAQDGYVQYKAPFGYEYNNRKLVVNEEEAAIVKEVYKAYLQEKSTLKVSKIFKLPRSLVYHILTSETYLGKVKWRDNVIDGAHEPLVDAKTFEDVRRILEKKRKR